MKIAAVTLVRNDSYFLKKWVSYYGQQVGLANLFVIARGADWQLPSLPPEVSRIIVSDSPSQHRQRNLWAANYVSAFVSFLLHTYDAVIRADVDEFVVADPASGLSLADVVRQNAGLGSISALGTDVVHKLSEEAALDPDRPALMQRRHGVVTREFSKPCIVTGPVEWDAGFHRIMRHEVRFATDLHLFHLALHDRQVAEGRIRERSQNGTSSSMLEHITSRLERFSEVEGVEPIEGDRVFESARQQISKPKRPGHIRTRPGFITENPNVERGYLIKIPERFAAVL